MATTISPVVYSDGSLRWVEVGAVAPEEGDRALWLDAVEAGDRLAPQRPVAVQRGALGGFFSTAGRCAPRWCATSRSRACYCAWNTPTLLYFPQRYGTD